MSERELRKSLLDLAARIPKRLPNASTGKIYIRNSGRDEKKKLAPEMQLGRAAFVLESLGATFNPQTDVYDEGEGQHSAHTRTNLDQFDDMIRDALADPNCKYIASYDSSRVFRNSEVGEHTIKLLESHGIEWHAFVNGQLSLSSDSHRLKTKIQLIMDEEESRRASRRMKDHYAAVKLKYGYAGHHSMYGLRRMGSEKNGTVQWEPSADFPVVVELLRLYATGDYSCRAIAEILYDKGYMWRNTSGQPSRPSGQTIHELIRKTLPFYEPLVNDSELIKQVRAVYEQRRGRKENGRVQKRPPLLLSKIVYCVCGNRFSAHWWRKNTPACKDKWHPYYGHYDAVGCKQQPRFVVGTQLHTEFLDRLEQWGEWTDKEIQRALTTYHAEPVMLPVPSRNNKVEIERLARQYANKALTMQEFLEQLQALEQPSAPPSPERSKRDRDEVEAILRNMRSLRLSLEMLYAKDPVQANKTLRALFRVIVESGHLKHIEVLGTDGAITF